MSTKPHTVVMVATSYPRFPGDGVGSFMEPIAKGVAARGHAVHLVAPWHPSITRRPIEDGVTFHFYKYAPVPALNVFGYAAGMSPDEFAEIRNTAVVLLRFVAAYCLFDAAQIVFVGVIKGAGDTRFVLISTVVIASTAIAVGVTVESLAGWGLYWWWTVITGWVFTLGIVYWARFEQGCWKTMRVIEPDVVVESAPPVVERGAHTVADTLVAAAPEQSSG